MWENPARGKVHNPRNRQWAGRDAAWDSKTMGSLGQEPSFSLILYNTNCQNSDNNNNNNNILIIPPRFALSNSELDLIQ